MNIVVGYFQKVTTAQNLVMEIFFILPIISPINA